MELEQFIRISRYAGERFDLVQAGGGNSSVKLNDGTMLIKASGYLLSEVKKNNGYAKVDVQKIKNILQNDQVLKAGKKSEKESIAASLVKEATLPGSNRPSIETVFHSILGKFVLHTHPLVVNMIVNQSGWKELLQAIFSKEEIVLIPYQTPGVELALELHREFQKLDCIPKLVFLQNHGLIVSSDHTGEVIALTDHVVNTIEKHLSLNLTRYKITNEISRLVHSFYPEPITTYLSEDIQINRLLASNKDLFFILPFCPDKMVFCGAVSVEIESLNDHMSIRKYKETYFELPKIIIYKNQLFVIAKNNKKAREIEEVLKFHVMALDIPGATRVNCLPLDELLYLSDWEAEKYRKKL